MRGPKIIVLPVLALALVVGASPSFAWFSPTDTIWSLLEGREVRSDRIDIRGLTAQTGEPIDEIVEVEESANEAEEAEPTEETDTGEQADPDVDEASNENVDGEASEPTLDQIVERVQSFYDEIDNYHAEFEQTYTNIALGDAQVSTGHVFFRKPGMMRWDYEAPLEKYLISDGETLWIYEPEFNQVARLDLSSSELPTAIRFLMGEGNLAEDFTITLAECNAPDAYCLDLVPRISQGHYQSLKFVVDSDEYSVRETTIVDPIGNQNHFEFRNAATTDELPEEGFHFSPTPDMRVITP